MSFSLALAANAWHLTLTPLSLHQMLASTMETWHIAVPWESTCSACHVAVPVTSFSLTQAVHPWHLYKSNHHHHLTLTPPNTGFNYGDVFNMSCSCPKRIHMCSLSCSCPKRMHMFSMSCSCPKGIHMCSMLCCCPKRMHPVTCLFVWHRLSITDI